MKTQEELNKLKEEVETVSKKLTELTEEELDQIFGGAEFIVIKTGCSNVTIVPDDPKPFFTENKTYNDSKWIK